MPVLNGFETFHRVKEMFASHNQRLNAQMGDNENKTYILRPLVVFFSQLEKDQFKHFYATEEQADFFLQKPLPLMELAALLRLLSLI